MLTSTYDIKIKWIQWNFLVLCQKRLFHKFIMVMLVL
jgi:hypothetical protein